MPQLAQYTSPINGLRPDEAGAETLARSGRFIESQYKEVGSELGGAVSKVGGQIGQVIDQHNEMTDLATSLDLVSQAKLARTDQWDQRLKDGAQQGNTDGLVGAQQQADSETWDNIMSQAKTPAVQKYLSERRAQDMDQSGLQYRAQVSHVSGEIVANQYEKSFNASNALVSRDPSQLSVALSDDAQALDAIKNTQKNLSPEDSLSFDKTQQQHAQNLASSAAQSLLYKTLPNGMPDPSGPAQLKDWLDSGKLDMLGEKKGGVAAEMERVAQTNKIIANQQLEAQDRAYSNQANLAGSTFALTGKASANGVYYPPEALAQLQNTLKGNPKGASMLLDANKLVAEGLHGASEVAPNSSDQSDIMLGIRDGTATASQIITAGADHKTTHEETLSNLSLLNNYDRLGPDRKLVSETMAAAKYQPGIVNKVLEGITGDPDGAARFSNIQSQFTSEYAKQRADGTLKPNARDLNDPTSLASQVVAANREPAAVTMAKMAQAASLTPGAMTNGVPTALAGRSVQGIVGHSGYFHDSKTGEFFDAFGHPTQAP